jgi:hypothetical protein
MLAGTRFGRSFAAIPRQEVLPLLVINAYDLAVVRSLPIFLIVRSLVYRFALLCSGAGVGLPVALLCACVWLLPLNARATPPDTLWLTHDAVIDTAMAQLGPDNAYETPDADDRLAVALAESNAAPAHYAFTLESLEAARRNARKLGLIATLTRRKTRGDRQACRTPRGPGLLASIFNTRNKGDRFACRTVRIPRRTLRFKAPPCDPNLRAVTTPEEKLGKAVQYLFTNKYKNCKLQAVTSPVATGQIVRTEQYGNAVVVDYVMAERVLQEALYKTNTAPRIIERKYKAIKQLVVEATEEKRMQMTGDGLRFESVVVKNPKTKTYKLSPTETKKIIVQRLLLEGRTEDMLRLYPEERENLDAWQKQYNVKTAALHRKDLGSKPLPAKPGSK